MTFWQYACLLVCAGLMVRPLSAAEEPAKKADQQATSPAKKQELPLKGTAKEWHTARKQGWQIANYIIEVLEGNNDPKTFPGIAAWLKDYQAAVREIDFKADPATWPMLDIDALVTRNPRYWQAYYEIAPGDSGLALLHGGLLLFGGESSRGSYVVIAFQQRPDIPEPIGRLMEGLVYQAQQARKDSTAKVMEGTKLYDEGKFDDALKLHDVALKLNPQDGFAHYEWGLTQRQKQWVAAGIKPPEGDKIVVNAKNLKFSPEVVAAFTKARRHDPFQWKAYQGEDREVIDSLQALVKKGMPNWEQLAKNRPKQIGDEPLMQLGEGCQESQNNELALVLRSVLIARRGSYAPADHPFLAKSLRALAPGEISEKIIEKLAGKAFPARQIVPPEKK